MKKIAAIKTIYIALPSKKYYSFLTVLIVEGNKNTIQNARYLVADPNSLAHFNYHASLNILKATYVILSNMLFLALPSSPYLEKSVATLRT